MPCIHSTLRIDRECHGAVKSASAKAGGNSHPFAAGARLIAAAGARTLLVAMLVATLVSALLASLAAPAAAQNLGAADAAFMQQRFPDAQRGYRAVLARGSAADRKKAALALAVIDWKIDGDTARAIRDLRPFIATAPALAMISRARLDAHNVAGARSAVRAALAAARDTDERVGAAIVLADVVAQPYESACLDSAPSRPHSHAAAREDSTLTASIARLRRYVIIEPGHLEISERLVRLAALAGDWQWLALGWRSYYAVGRRVPGGPLVRAESELRAMQNAPASEKAQHAFVALVDSKMFEPAALLATCGPLASRSSDASTSEIIAYAHFLREARRITNGYYRDVALGRADTNAWRGSLDVAGRRLWPQLEWRQPAPKYNLGALMQELGKRFDLLVNMGNTGGVVDLHSGHRISSENREVGQYGKSAHLRFAVLDGVISDGYQTWAWDGRAAHGGWADDVEIIQVREAYADGPLKVWHALTEPAIIAREAKKLAHDSIADLERARMTEVAYFPSVEARLNRDAIATLLDSLQRGGLSARDLQLAFVRTYGDDVDESSIFAHEGRHAIDKTMHVRDSTASNLEYQAKLSEIAFAPLPRLALSGILGAIVGDGTPHGIADARIMREILDWMRHNGIADGAAGVPLPLQIPKLSDAQLRTMSRSFDPLAADSSLAASKP